MDMFHAIKVFVRVVDLGSFTAAAESLGYSTPHVSRTLSDLEDHLQAKLINRTTRRLAPTDAGKRFLERGRLLLEDLKSAEMEASGAHLEAFGTLRMHAPNGIGRYHIIPLMAEYRALHPKVNFELALGPIAPDLLAGGFDLQILGDNQIPDSGFICQTIGTTYSVVCAGPGYLAERGEPMTLEELATHTCLQLSDPAFPKGWEIEGLEIREDTDAQPVFRVNVADAIAQAAKSNMGLVLIPGYVAASAVRSGELVRVLPEIKAHVRNISVLYPSRRFLDAKVRTWIDFLKENLPRRQAMDELSLCARGATVMSVSV